MKKIFKEFKEFAVRGNVIDMAVGIIIGGAFGKIVSSIVSDVIMPAVGVLIGGIDFKDLKLVLKEAAGEAPAVVITYGNFIQSTVDFIIIALAVFLFIKLINSAKKKEEEVPATPPPTPEDIQLLQEIRDLLKNK